MVIKRKLIPKLTKEDKRNAAKVTRSVNRNIKRIKNIEDPKKKAMALKIFKLRTKKFQDNLEDARKSFKKTLKKGI